MINYKESDKQPIYNTDSSRYNYVVKASFQNSDFENGMKDKLDEFLHFLNI